MDQDDRPYGYSHTRKEVFASSSEDPVGGQSWRKPVKYDEGPPNQYSELYSAWRPGDATQFDASRELEEHANAAFAEPVPRGPAVDSTPASRAFRSAARIANSAGDSLERGTFWRDLGRKARESAENAGKVSRPILLGIGRLTQALSKRAKATSRKVDGAWRNAAVGTLKRVANLANERAEKISKSSHDKEQKRLVASYPQPSAPKNHETAQNAPWRSRGSQNSPVERSFEWSPFPGVDEGKPLPAVPDPARRASLEGGPSSGQDVDAVRAAVERTRPGSSDIRDVTQSANLKEQLKAVRFAGPVNNLGGIPREDATTKSSVRPAGPVSGPSQNKSGLRR